MMLTPTIQPGESGIANEPVGWLARFYHENSKITPASLSDVEARIAAAGLDEERLRPRPVMEPSLPRVPLPRIRGWTGLARIIRRRRTIRALAARPISPRQLARILFNANGVTHWPTGSGDAPTWPLRSAPSAGALYPVELRVAALNVRGLQGGVYRYHPYDHCLEMLTSTVSREELAQASLHPDLVRSSAAVFAVFADWNRLVSKYGDRGYRFALLETGHVAQNVLLTCTSLRLGAVPIGGYLDDECARHFASSASCLTYLLVVGPPTAATPDSS